MTFCRAATARALQARYPGVEVSIEYISCETSPATAEYRGWRVDFVAPADLLIRHGLATQEEVSKTVRDEYRYYEGPLPDDCGHSRHLHPRTDDRLALSFHVPDVIPEGHWSERRVHTKKMQREVAKLLKRAFAVARPGARS